MNHLKIKIKNNIFEAIYFIYSLYPNYIIINFIRYLGRNISLHSFIFSKNLGKGIRIHGGVFMDNLSSIGDYSYIGGDQLRVSHSKINYTTIGKYCSISQNLNTLPFGHNYKYISTFPFNTKENKNKNTVITKKIVIQDGVWIGSNVIILGGVTIHEGSVIGAGSVVTKDVPAYTIVAGNPASIIKKRFSDNNINKLLKMNIYSNIDRININDLLDSDIELFIKKYSNIS